MIKSIDHAGMQKILAERRKQDRKDEMLGLVSKFKHIGNYRTIVRYYNTIEKQMNLTALPSLKQNVKFFVKRETEKKLKEAFGLPEKEKVVENIAAANVEKVEEKKGFFSFFRRLFGKDENTSTGSAALGNA